MMGRDNLPKCWKTYKFTDIAEIIGGGTPSKKISEYWNGNIDWLTVTDFNTGRKYVISAEQKITNLGLEKSSTKILKKGQIIISARGTVGVIAMLGKDMAFNQSNYGINAKEDITFNDFLYYLLKYKINELKQASYGAVFDTITKSTFENLEIHLPPLPEQKTIASVLSSLDDKIDLLHRQNKNLEQMAETLFRQWFIEEAKEDWEEIRLGDLIKISSGKGLKREEFVENGLYPVLGANGEIGRTNTFLFDERLIFTGRVGTLGNVFISEEKVWLSDNTLIIRPISQEFFYFVYFFLKLAKLEELNVGSTQPLIRQTDLKDLEMIVPDKETINRFHENAERFFNKIRQNQKQIRTLEQLRNTLLPKLMSGEVRVKL